MKSQHTLFITGGAGYVGAMLADQFSRRDDVLEIICLDKEDVPGILKDNKKIFWIKGNTADNSWQKVVALKNPDIVIHTAWQIREFYSNKKLGWHWNIDGSNAVFDTVFALPSVSRFVHFSTVASYGAFPTNTIEYAFSEEDALRVTDYGYAEEKRNAEQNLRAKFIEAKKQGNTPQVFVVRPVAITGPRGRARTHFGLQTALSGNLKGQSLWYRLVSFMVSWVPVTPTWLRQYVHEDDLTNIVEALAFGDIAGEYEIFNAAPHGPVVLGRDMARAVGKRSLAVYPWMVRVVFFLMWHLTRGKIPTAPGSWMGYSYPIRVLGSKITKRVGYNYKYESFEAFTEKTGRYENSSQ